MEPHHNSDSNSKPSSASEGAYSRVSNPLLQSDCSEFGDNRGLDDFDPVIGSNIVKTDKHEEYNRLAVHLRGEIRENTSLTSGLDNRAEELVTNFSVQTTHKTTQELFSKRSFQDTQEAGERYHMDCSKGEFEEDSITLRQNNILKCSEKIISSNWDKIGKYGSETSGQSAGHINNDESYIMGNPVAGKQETLCTEKNYEKGAHTSKEMVKAKVSNVNLIQQTNESDVKRNSLYPQLTENRECETQSSQMVEESKCHQNQGRYFCYDSPLFGETGAWIPVSVPPMSESEHEEWNRGFCSNGGYLPDGDTDWNQCMGEDKELTMWDVVVDMLLAARGKVQSVASGDIGNMSWISSHLIEQAWKEMAQTLTEANFGNAQEILEADPPKWLPDSASSSCMLCSVRFHPIMCSRHHCRFCGGIFCNECTKGRSLLPEKFRTGEPQRVCDVCCVRLDSVQPYLMDQVSRAAQLPTHDLTDLSTLRSWVNFPWGQSMEYEIYKATNAIRGYERIGLLSSEKKIPEAILQNARGLAILTVVKVGVMVTYNIGTGLVIARREDGSWSPPSAISSFGVGWGAQAGGELTDFIIVLRTTDAVKTFGGDAHLSVGAGVSAAAGIIGRTAEADLRAGTGGYAACYTYSCSKGAFVGCSLQGSVVTTRTRENSRFYGSQSLKASEILLGSLPRPPAAATLYRALADLYQKL
uniref:Zinc finger FYVE domain-containing protein 16 n=1 Tax=Nicotiana tabacum TaxID=4097 RepID=A0A1S4B2M4_TOBAC|nr:PREDICTED: zinc finger FYVE domain-containing protein 16-like [Nicotiana tabacum]